MTTTVPCYMPYLGDPRRPCVLPIDHDGPHVTRNGRGWHDSDDMDGGVAAALIEKEAEQDEGAHIGPEGETDWHGLYLSENRRAEKAEKDRDKARADARRASERWRNELTLRLEVADELRRLRATQPRPLTPDAITDEMVERAHRSLISHHGYGRILRSQVCEALTAALTEPPARPEGAEEIEAILSELPDTMLPATDAGRADLLAARGVRVVTEEQP